MQILDQKFPRNGMNRDDESRLVANDESRYILNLRTGSSEDDNVGAVENIKGTTQVLFDLPQGRNVCLKSYNDIKTNTNFFFIYNSNGLHSIYRYFPESRTVNLLAQDELFNFNENHLVNDVSVIDGRLLKFRDDINPPRKINLEKADADKLNELTFNWYLGDKYLENETSLDIDITIRNSRYDAIQSTHTATLSVNQSLIDDKSELAKDLASQINAISSLNNTTINWSAESCGDFVKITTTEDFYSFVAKKSGNDTVQIVPQNHYQSYVERTIDEIKHPPHCEVKALLKTDEEFKRNYITKKVFQFALRYIYDDGEKSTVNPHSVNAYNKYICESYSTEDLNNYWEIRLDTFPELEDLNEVQTIKRIEIYVSEGKDGAWKSFKTLEQYQFIDTEDQHVNFYNDGIYNVVDQDNFNRPFDYVPQLSKNMGVAKNRTFFANNLEGYDNVCVDAGLDVEYEDKELLAKPPTYSVEGSLVIRSSYNKGDGNTGYYHQPIWRNLTFGNAEICWGGLQTNGIPGHAQKTGQTLDESLGGFTVYLAGTNHYAITKQRPGDLDSKTTQDNKGIYTWSGSPVGKASQILENMQKQTFTINNFTFGSNGNVNGVMSDFEIKNVPEGWYWLRVASHKTTLADLDSGSLDYQKTSTNTFKVTNWNYKANVLNPTPPTPPNAAMIEGVNEILVYIDGSQGVDNIQIEILDQSHDDGGVFGGGSKICTGYVVDNDITGSVSTYDDYLAENRIAGARVEFNLKRETERGSWAIEDSAITDHNGYFFFASTASFSKLDLEDINSAYLPSTFSNIRSSDVHSGDANYSSISNIGEDEWVDVAIRAKKGATDGWRVWVTGSIVDALNIGIPETNICSSRAIASITDGDGDYGFWHYDIYNNLLAPSSSGSNCPVYYQDTELYMYQFQWNAIYVDNFINYVSPKNIPKNGSYSGVELTVTVPPFIGDTSAQQTFNGFKRGFDGKFGIVYFDRGMRSGAVNTIDDLNLHIPFYTEKDSDDQIKVGVPIVNWTIKHRPPSWATHWQWVRTRNTKVGSYFQWTVEDVSYSDDDGNLKNYSSATRVRLNIGNLQQYKELNPTFDFEAVIDNETWRVRFIKDQNESRYQEYLDFKVLAVDGEEIIIEKDFSQGELKKGILVEFYSELPDFEVDVYYEFGECFEIGTDNLGNKFHKGLTTNQNSFLPSTFPATGTFRTGDAYYRLRQIPNVTSNTPAYIDDDAASDFYLSEVESIGRVNVENPDAKQAWKPNQMRHGGRWVDDTNINFLNRFNAEDLQDLPVEYGAINKLVLASNVLISIHEERWVSNYIEEAIVRKQGGGDDLVASTDVFGSFRAAKDNVGTINPESVVEFRGNVYAFDMNKGIVSRWGADGLTAISNNKMFNYFSDKSKELLNLYNNGLYRLPKIIGVYDEKFNEYILSFGDTEQLAELQDPTGGGGSNATHRVQQPINNSVDISSDDVTSDTLYIGEVQKKSGSNIIFNETDDLEGLQVDNPTYSDGKLRVKVKGIDGIIREVVELYPGQGIGDLNLNTLNYSRKAGSDDRTSQNVRGKVVIPAETISFSEKVDKWITYYSFTPEMFGNIGLDMVGFTGGKLWIHNDSDVYNNFYGKQYDSQIEVIANIEPDLNKVWQSLEVESYHPWYSPKITTPNGRETEVVKGRWVKKEDSFFAPIMKDKNDPRVTDGVVNGRQLRDRVCKILLVNDETEKITLFSINTIASISPRKKQ
jgi:hypothetical protein